MHKQHRQYLDNTGQQTIDNTGQQIDNINNKFTTMNNKFTTMNNNNLFTICLNMLFQLLIFSCFSC